MPAITRRMRSGMEEVEFDPSMEVVIDDAKQQWLILPRAFRIGASFDASDVTHERICKCGAIFLDGANFESREKTQMEKRLDLRVCGYKTWRLGINGLAASEIAGGKRCRMADEHLLPK